MYLAFVAFMLRLLARGIARSRPQVAKADGYDVLPKYFKLEITLYSIGDTIMISIKSAASVTRKLFSGLAAVVLILGLATSAQAQQSGGSIRGTVVGADAGTVVEVRDDSRGTMKSKSTSDGSFRFDGLQTGSYEVRVLQGGNMVDSATVTVSLGSERQLQWQPQ